jgi:hypothetical protein
MNFFIGDERAETLSHPVRPGESVHILAALSGG